MRGVALGSKIAARVPVASLHPAPWNPRTLTEERFENLKRSLAADPRLLELRPILADAQGEVYAGNMRLRAAIALGWTDVPAVLEDVDDLTRKERMVRDNAQWGEWQDDQLAEVLHSIAEAGADTSILGLDELELARIIDGIRPVGEDDVPEPPDSPVTKPGDLYVLGEHRLLCGDSTKAEDVARLMDGVKADLVFTDPPYGVGYDGGAKRRQELLGDHVGTTIYADALPHLKMAAADHAALYLWYADAHAAAAAAAAAGYVITAQIIWVKNNAQFVTSAHYKGKHEPCFYAHRKGRAAKWCGPNNEVTVWEVDRAQTNEFHPTQKPVELVARAIRNSSEDHDLVLDLFGGSGSTMIAAEQTGRRAYLMEIDPGYCDVIVKRWENLTSKTAVLQ